MIRLFVGLVALSSALAGFAAEAIKFDGHEAHPSRLLVKLKAGQNLARLGAAAPDYKLTRSYSQVPGLAVVEVKDQAKLKAAVAGNADPAASLKKSIQDLRNSGIFDYVEPDYVLYGDLTPTDRAFLDGRLWGLQNSGQQGGVAGADINVVNAWDLTTGDANIVVGVIDSGVNYNHQDLQAQMWQNPDEIPGNGIDDDNNGFIDDVHGINAIVDTGDPLDDHGHGSHCAGTIGAAANNGFEHVGVIWQVRIMALKFLSAQNSGFTSDAIQCVNYAISKRAKLTSNSWGGGGFNQALIDAITAARAQNQLFIAAAGNSASDNDTFPSYPASYDLDNIVSVAALDRRDDIAIFSNFGLTSVDIGAPGVEIFSCWMGPTNAYNTIDGTSMACPHVAGVAALSWSTDLAASYSEVRDRILQSAIPISALAGKCTTGGRVNAFGSLGGNVDGILEISVLPPAGTYFGTGTRATISVKVRDAFNLNTATVAGRFNNTQISFLNDGAPPDAAADDGVYTATLTMPNTPGNYTLGLDVSAPGKTSAHVDVPYLVLAPPSNDHFAQASKIPPGGALREADNRLATPEPGAVSGDPNYGPDIGEPLHAGVSNTRSLWWSWSTTNSTPVIVDTAGTSFDDDAVLGVYNGSRVSALTEVASSIASANGPNGTRAPFVKFTAQPNLTYWIAVAQSQLGTNSPGRVQVRLEPNGDIDITPPTVRVTNFISGVFIRSRTNVVIISGTSDDPPPNSSGVASVAVKANNEPFFTPASGTTNWVSQPIILNNGVNTIFIRAFDKADNESQTVQLTLNYIPQELSNDLFGNAETLLGTSGVVSASNTAAAKEFDEPAHGGNEGGHSLWWTFTPPSDGILVLNTEGSTFDTLLGLYYVTNPETQRSVSSIKDKVVAQNDDAPGNANGASEISVAVQQNRLYYIAVDGFAGQSGTVQLNYNFAALEVFPLTVTAGPGGTVAPASADFPSDSAVTLQAMPDRNMQFAQYTITSGGQTVITNRNPFTFVLTGDTAVHAEFAPKQYTFDFATFGDLASLGFQTSTFWGIGSTNNAINDPSTFAAVAQNLDDEGNSTVAVLTLHTNLTAGVGSFEFRVKSEKDYDFLEFLLDDRSVAKWSGDLPWQFFQFDIPNAGLRKLEWRYKKDQALSETDEFVGIDNIDLPIAPPVVITDVTLTVTMSAGLATINVVGPPNSDFRLETTTNLSDWESWSPVPGAEKNSPSGVTSFTYPIGTETGRFFQVLKL